MTLTLKRTISLPSGTYGLLIVDGLAFCLTLEPAQPIIQTGTHACHRAWFNRDKYEVFEVDTPGHSNVYLHVGNSTKDTEGCVLLGMGIWPQYGISQSKAAFNAFMDRLDGVQAFDLEVL